ncbi:MAG: hypothetical protein AABY22_09680 [Nanoarchaeota archaeon]
MINQTTQTRKEEKYNFWTPNKKLSGNMFFYGRTDSGKTFSMMHIVQLFHSRGYKIFDMFGGKRNESGFWCFPSDEKRLWANYEMLTGGMTKEGPKEYEVNLLFPMFSNLLPKKLPQLPPRVKCKIFTIPISSVTYQDISLVTGDLPGASKALWNTLQNAVGSKGTLSNIMLLMETTELKRYKNLTLYKYFLKTLSDNHLLSNDYCDMNIGLSDEAKNNKAITVLCHEFIPEDFKFFVMGYILRNIFDLANTDKISKENIGVFREANFFMKREDEDTLDSEQRRIFRNLVSNIARYARTGLFLTLDTQSPKETKGLISGQDDLLIIKEMSSLGDREEICIPLIKDKRMSSRQMASIGMLEPHQAVIVERKEKAKLIRYLPPPRSMQWKQGKSSFLVTWKNIYDSWMNTDLYIDNIKQSYEDSVKTLIEEYKRRYEQVESPQTVTETSTPMLNETIPISVENSNPILIPPNPTPTLIPPPDFEDEDNEDNEEEEDLENFFDNPNDDKSLPASVTNTPIPPQNILNLPISKIKKKKEKKDKDEGMSLDKIKHIEDIERRKEMAKNALQYA